MACLCVLCLSPLIFFSFPVLSECLYLCLLYRFVRKSRDTIKPTMHPPLFLPSMELPTPTLHTFTFVIYNAQNIVVFVACNTRLFWLCEATKSPPFFIFFGASSSPASFFVLREINVSGVSCLFLCWMNILCLFWCI